MRAWQVADGSFMMMECPQNRHDSAPEVLAQALWAVYHATSFVDGLDRLMALSANNQVLSTYATLAAALFGENQLPIEWCLLLHKADLIHQLARDLAVSSSNRCI